jgi:predicted acylesterase/phospholipase RssA
MSVRTSAAAAVVLVTSVVVAMAPAPARADSPAVSSESPPFSITLQGAASLGTYEAALTWTLIRLIRAQRLLGDSQRTRLSLEALSGSSAGSVNALLSAALWCEAEDEVGDQSVDRNLLRDSWLPVGLDELLPGDPGLYTSGDGLFASSAFAPIVESVQSRVFSKTGIRFRPGCRVPIGFTATRVVPELRTVSGLRVQSQQAMVPLIFEVDAAGVARLRRDTSLPFSTTLADSATLAETIDTSGPFVPADEAIQALLASAAFPLAFGARPLCECRLACGDGQREVTAMECPGPVPGKPLSKLSCSAYTAPHGGQAFKLCRSNFLDGGFLDNAPVGLAVEQAEAFAPPRTLFPLSVLLVDPEVRRPRPDLAPAPEKGAQGITDAVTLANNLVTTAREQRLAEAVASRHWNLSTRTLLRRSASALVAYGSIVSPLVDPRATQADEAEPPVWRPKSEERGAFGRFLDGCLRRPLSAAKLEACAAAVEGHDTSNFLLDAGARAAGTTPLTPEEALHLAEALPPFLDALASGGAGTNLSQPSTVAAGALAFLADELLHYVAQVTDETALRRMRAACLRSALAVKALPGRTIQVARMVLTGAVRQLTAPGVPPVVSSAATELLATLATASTAQLFSGGLSGPLQEALSAVPRESLSEVARNAGARLSLLGQLRPRIARLSDDAVRISQDADEIESDARGQRRLFVATRFSPLAGAKLEHFAGFMDRPLRELDYYTGIYEALRATANRACSEQDPYFTGRPEPLLKPDGSWELDPSQEQTQRCYGAAMGSFIEYLQILASPKAGPVVLALARRELSAWLGSSSAADRLASTPEWSWLGPTPPDLRRLGSMGTALAVLLEPATPCTPSAKEALCIGELNFQQFLVRLEAAGYQPESKAMEAALADQGRWLSQTVQRALDRAGTIEIVQDSPQSSTEKAVNVLIGGGETVSRYAEREGKILFQVDPSTIPLRPLADGSYLPIVLAHLVPYRVALDVVGGSIALSWLEPRLQLGRWFSVDSTLQLIDIQFSSGVVSSTLGVRGVLHLGPVGIGSGPRWSLAWGGGSQFGVEFDVLILQDRLGVSFGFRNLTGGSWNSPFVALTVADLNGMLYWLIPSAWRSGR